MNISKNWSLVIVDEHPTSGLIWNNIYARYSNIDNHRDWIILLANYLNTFQNISRDTGFNYFLKWLYGIVLYSQYLLAAIEILDINHIRLKLMIIREDR